MKWIVYSAAMEEMGNNAFQVRRAPMLQGDNPHLAAERLGGTLLAVQTSVRKAENFRQLIEFQAHLEGKRVVSWEPPAEWEQRTAASFAVPRLNLARN